MGNEYICSMQLWEKKEYGAALEIWKDCLEKKEFIDEIIGNIREAFLIPNRDEFIEILKKNWKLYFGEKLSFNQAQEKYSHFNVRYLCYEDGKYYVFDEEKSLLIGKIDFSLKNSEMIFDDTLIVNPEAVTDITNELNGKYKRKIYCIGRNDENYFSIYCLPEISEILEQKIIFFRNCKEEADFFMENPSMYLPKRIKGYADECMMNEIMQTFTSIHNKRLQKEFRDNSNVLLTIGIPTYNRGKRALENVLHCLGSLYDAEIEIVVSDNGSDIQGEEYKEIAELQDARVKYYRTPENQGFMKNMKKVFEIASGRYVLLTSDEDLVIIENLSHYLGILRNNDELGLLRGSITGNTLQSQHEFGLYKKGVEAVNYIFLANNYMSGSIYACNNIVRNMFDELSWKYKDEVAFLFYPHMFLDVKIAEKYNICDSETLLIYTGKQEDSRDAFLAHTGKTTGEESVKIQEYTKVDSRIRQHGGWRRLLESMDMISTGVKYALYIKTCDKIFWLVYLVKWYYVNQWEETCKKIVEACAIEFDNICFLNEKQKDMVRDEFVEILYNLYQEYLTK